MTSFLHPPGRHRGLRGRDGSAGERAGIDGRSSGQLGGGRHARWASCAVIESSSRGGTRRRRRQRNRGGHRPSGRCRSGQRTELQLVHRRGCSDVLGWNGIGRAQGHLRLCRRVAELTSNGGWRIENRVQHPNALARGSAARGQWQILFPSNISERIRPTIFRYICPRGDTPDPHVFRAGRVTGNSANLRPIHTGGKGILERRQVSGQQISLD